MKTLFNTRLKKIKFLATTFTFVFIILILSGTASAQVPAKGKKVVKVPHAILNEAKITAHIVTTVEEVRPMIIRINVLNPTGKTVSVSLVNYRNQPFFKDTFSGKEYNKTLNCKDIAADRYRIRIIGRKHSDVRWFVIKSKRNRNLNQAELIKGSNLEVMAHINKPEPNIIKLHLSNNSGKAVKYILRNEVKEVINSGIVRNTQFTKTFNMASMTDGKYTLEVNYQSEKIASRAFDVQTIYNQSFAWTDKRGKLLKPAGMAAFSQSYYTKAK